MSKRKKKASTPIMLFWSKRDQVRFIEAVEKFHGLVNDMETVLTPVKRKRDARAALDQAKEAAAANGAAAAAQAEKGSGAMFPFKGLKHLGDYRRDQKFNDVWEELAEEGKCDGPGGAEYKRVFDAWVDAGRPVEIRAFIQREANKPPRS